MSDSHESKGLLEETKKALTEDVEVPIDKKVPGATFGLVALSYFVVLVIGGFVLAFVLWATGLWSETEPPLTPQTPPGIALFGSPEPHTQQVPRRCRSQGCDNEKGFQLSRFGVQAIAFIGGPVDGFVWKLDEPPKPFGS